MRQTTKLSWRYYKVFNFIFWLISSGRRVLSSVVAKKLPSLWNLHSLITLKTYWLWRPTTFERDIEGLLCLKGIWIVTPLESTSDTQSQYRTIGSKMQNWLLISITLGIYPTYPSIFPLKIFRFSGDLQISQVTFLSLRLLCLQDFDIPQILSKNLLFLKLFGFST